VAVLLKPGEVVHVFGIVGKGAEMDPAPLLRQVPNLVEGTDLVPFVRGKGNAVAEVEDVHGSG
jgi:hypothetical protein